MFRFCNTVSYRYSNIHNKVANTRVLNLTYDVCQSACDNLRTKRFSRHLIPGSFKKICPYIPFFVKSLTTITDTLRQDISYMRFCEHLGHYWRAEWESGHHHHHIWHDTPLRVIAFLGFPDNRIFTGQCCQPDAQPPTWRTRPPYLWPPEIGWPSYSPRHWVPILVAFYDTELVGTILILRSPHGESLHIIGEKYVSNRTCVKHKTPPFYALYNFFVAVFKIIKQS
jgi:hypothetical protein